jgi:hypothetical protein
MTVDAATPRSALRIGRLNATWLVPRDHPSPELLRARLDRMLQSDLAPACDRIAAPLCQDSDTSVWFIRRLVVNLAVDASADTRRMTEAWAGQLVRALERQLRLGDDGVEALRFPNRTAWIAQFLCDLADGVAWSKWYYRGFDGLRFLAASAAMREAISREPQTGEAALRQLAGDSRLRKVLSAVSNTDCRAIWRVFREQDAREEADALTTDHLRTAARAWQNIRTLEPNHRASLELFFALPSAPQRARPALRQGIETLLALVRALNSTQGEQLLLTLESGEMRSFVSLAGEGVEFLAVLLARDRGAVREVVCELRSWKAGPTSSPTPGTAEIGFTPFGGIFLLLPHFAEIGLTEPAEVLPEFEDKPPLALTRFLVMLKCLGGANASHAFFDPVLRELAGVSPDLEVASLRAWAKQITRKSAVEFHQRRKVLRSAYESTKADDPEIPQPSDGDLNYLNLANLLRGARSIDSALSAIAHDVLRAFAHHLPGFSRSSAAFLHANFLDVRATVGRKPECWQVRVTRAPLHIVPAMICDTQNNFRFCWSSNLEIQLTTGES